MVDDKRPSTSTQQDQLRPSSSSHQQQDDVRPSTSSQQDDVPNSSHNRDSSSDEDEAVIPSDPNHEEGVNVITPDIRIRKNYGKRRKREKIPIPGGGFIERSFSNKDFIDYVIPNPKGISNFSDYLSSVRLHVNKLLEDEVCEKGDIKSNMFFVVVYSNINNVILEYAYKTPNSIIVGEDDVHEHVNIQIARLLTEIDNRELAGSGYTVKSIKHLEVRVSKVRLLRGRGFIALPKWLLHKNAIINIRSDSNECFKYCILAKYNKSNHSKVHFSNVKKYENNYDFNINFPPSINDVKLFCRLNNVSINVFGIMGRDVYPILVPRDIKEEHFDLLYLEDGKTAHYCLISNLSRLLSTQVSKRCGTKYFCRRCLLFFYKKESLEVHIQACSNEKLAFVKLPNGREYFKFEKYDACQLAPLLMTLDMEAFLIDISTCTPSPDSSFTNPIHLHVPVSFGSYLFSHYPQQVIPMLPLGYVGRVCKKESHLEDALVEYFDLITQGSAELFARNFPIHMSSDDITKFNNATHCYICQKRIRFLDVRVADHDHYLPELNYRGAAHSICNINMKKINYVPVYVQSLSTYDSHHLLRIFAKRHFKIHILPCTLEKYLSFSIWMNCVEIRFLDSYRLLHASLHDITTALPKELFKITKQTFKPNLHNLLLSKGPFPYSFLSQVERLDYDKYPDKSWFDNDLTREKIDESEYERGHLIWNEGKCKTFKDFLSIYQCSDTVQLADCILYIRSLFWDKFGLDVTAFFSLPHLSMSSMLKYTGIHIELISSEMGEAYDLIKRSIYGGFSLCPLRYVMAEDNPPDQDNVELYFTDCTGLYAYCMERFPMPVGEFEFVDVNLNTWSDVDIFGEYGYFLEVNLSFPRSCHDYLNCLPPLCERKKPDGCNTVRLVNDFTPKLNYVLSLAHFQLVLKVGGQCDKIWRVLRFRQSNYLRSYIEVVSQWRRESKSTCESNFYKLSLNSLYGKFNEVLEKRRRVELVTCDKRLAKLVRKGTFVERHILNFPGFSMVLVELAKGVIKQNRPNIVGSQILAFSKVYMLEFWYDVLKPTFKNKSLELVLMDTDSFLFKVRTKSLYDDLKTIKHHFDFSSLDVDHPLYSPANSKIFGTFKDESNGKRILGVCTPRTKAYSIKYAESVVNKLKGVQRSFVKHDLFFEDYKKCVLEKSTKMANFKNIVSQGHILYTVEINKLALESSDYKRSICADGIHTLAYGHYKLTEDHFLH